MAVVSAHADGPLTPMPALLAALDIAHRGRSPDPLLERASRATVLFHSTKVSRQSSGSIGLLRFADARDLRTPWVNGRTSVLLDGRFDNGEDLRYRLGLAAHVPDEAVVYEIWRTRAGRVLADIEGSWAWILWDAESRTLWAGRDVLGRRTMFFAERAGWLVCGTQLHAVAAALDLSSADLSASYVAAFLTVGKARPGETPYAGVSALRAGHLLEVEQGVRLSRVQTLEPSRAPIPKTVHECAREFRRLLAGILRPLIAREGVVWFDLSGGLDSSSLVCLAAEIASQDATSISRFRTLSLLGRGDEDSAQHQAIRDVTRATGFANTQVHTDALHPFQDLMDGGLAWDYPTLEILVWRAHREIVDRVSATPASAYLKGLGAEAVLFGEQVPPIHLADLIRGGRLLQWAHDAGEWRRAMQLPALPFVWAYSLRPLLDRRHLHVESPTMVPEWMSDELCAESGVERWRGAIWGDVRFRSRATQWEHEHLARLPESLHKGPLHRTCNVELPYVSEGLVRWCMAVPWETRITPIENKRLLRIAMAGVLPERIRSATGVTTGNGSMTRGLQKEWAAVHALMTDSLVARAGWIDEKRLLQELRRARQGCCSFLPGALRPVALEVWLRSRFEARSGGER